MIIDNHELLPIAAAATQLTLGSESPPEDQANLKTPKATDNSQTVAFLSPKCIGHGSAPNRGKSDYHTDEYFELERQINETCGNLIPIRVVLLPEPKGDITHEITYGHRRHHACLARNHLVRAIVITNSSESQELEEQLLENEGRAQLTPFDFGRQCVYRLDNHLYPTQEALARKLGRKGNAEISNGVTLARLPEKVIAAFTDSSELGFRDAQPLRKMMEENGPSVMEAAMTISQARQDGKTWSKEQVMAALKAASTTAQPDDSTSQSSRYGPSKSNSATAIKFGDIFVGEIVSDKKGRTKLTLDCALDTKQRIDLAKRLAKIYESQIAKTAACPATTTQ